MKNLFLSVVLLLTVSFVFATNDVEKVSAFDVEDTINLSEDINSLDTTEFSWNLDSLDKLLGTCTITVTTYNEEGEVIDTQTISFESTETQCWAIANLIRR